MILVNEQNRPFSSDQTIADIAASYKPAIDIFILNVFPLASVTPVKDRDSFTLIQKGKIPKIDELEALLSSRHTCKDKGIHHSHSWPWRFRIHSYRNSR